MSNRTKIVGLYKIADDEVLQFTVTIASNYPDAISEAKATILGCLHDALADVLTQTRRGTNDED